MGILSSLKIVEFEGIGPGPFCAMLFADLGAEVVVIERKAGPDLGEAGVARRGKKSITLDLKNAEARDAAIRIAASADALIEGMRPGVMERLGLGPEIMREANPRLVYGRVTGWGQDGPLSRAAGHDINYASLAGAAWYSGPAGGAPVPPPTLVGDVAGGALYLAIGILAGVTAVRAGGEGTVVDAAMVDGAAHMMNLLLMLRASGGLPDDRGQSMLDGAHFYEVYQCADGKYFSIGALEPQFYALLLEKLGLAEDPAFRNQHDRDAWPALKERLRALFATRTRDEWAAQLEGTDVCFAPVLAPSEAMRHPHMKAREAYREIHGVLQGAPAPRFSAGAPPDPGPVPERGGDGEEILRAAGFSEREIAALLTD